MIKEFEYLNDTSFTNEQSKILESYYKKLFSGETLMKIRTDDNALSMYHDQTLTDLQILEEAFDAMEKAAEKGVDNLFTTYNNLNLNKEMQAVIDESNPFIKYLSNLFKDSPGTIDVFQGMPLTTDLIRQLGENLEEEGYDIGNVLNDVVAKYRELQKLNPDVDNQLLQSQAWALVASETDNAVVKTQLYGMASIKTTQEVSQALDTVQNKLKSMSEQQQKYLSGEMSNQEIYEFVENNAKLFGQEGVLEDFLAGRDITNKVLDSMGEAYIDAQQRLITINNELLGDLKESDREALIKEKNALILMTRYRGEVAGITKNQIGRSSCRERGEMTVVKI